MAADTDDATDLYERSGGTTTLISTGPSGGNGAFDVFYGDTSADGSRVLFVTSEQLVASDSDSAADVYERAGGATSLLSTGPAGGNGAFDAPFRAASLDGSRVFFETEEPLVASDNDTSQDVYERAGGTTSLLSTGPAGGNGAFEALFNGASEGGTKVFFQTDESLTASDTDSASTSTSARAAPRRWSRRDPRAETAPSTRSSSASPRTGRGSCSAPRSRSSERTPTAGSISTSARVA